MQLIEGPRDASDWTARAWVASAVMAGLFLSLWINFHWYLTDFNLVPGDRGDSRLMVFVLEHWFRVFRGLEPFFRLRMFYPDPNALAYADGLFLFGLPYAAFRQAGLDYFTSYQLVQALLSAVGYVAWACLLRKVLKLPVGLAILGGILLCSMNALQRHADIGKLTALNLVPILLLWLWSYIAGEEHGGEQSPWGLVGFAVGMGLLFYTSYYVAWLLLFALVILGVLTLTAHAAAAGIVPTVNMMRAYGARRWWHVLLALLAFILALTPFLITYAPLVAGGSTRSFDLVLEFSPSLKDVVNVSPRNVVWSPLLRALGYGFGDREVQMGSPMLALLIAGATTLILVRRARKEGWRGISGRDRALLLLAGTAVVLVVLTLRLGNNSLWYIIYRILPGASALRALGRMLILVDLIIIIIAMCGLQLLFARWASRGPRGSVGSAPAFAAIAIALIAEQMNWSPFRLDKAEELARVKHYEVPSVDCAAFYTINASPQGLPIGYYELDAMMIGMRLVIPTVNGYSGFEPHEAFHLVPKGPEYHYLILDWLQSRGATEGVCELDLESGEFRIVDVNKELPIAQQDFRASLLGDFTALHEAASRFLRDGNSPENLYPQYLEQHGYLDPSFGYATGAQYRWIRDRYWIGERACGNKKCLGVGVLGTYADVRTILERYAGQARDVYFPNPQRLDEGTPPAGDMRGELLMLFPTTPEN
ncbi:MAG TPA: hypothetical protein VFH29_04280 [Anaerolineales bacterium]|nr:hypothetical protein [Anaerolineales bacterium]